MSHPEAWAIAISDMIGFLKYIVPPFWWILFGGQLANFLDDTSDLRYAFPLGTLLCFAVISSVWSYQ